MTSGWLLFVIAGYAQWFLLVPRLLKLRRKMLKDEDNEP
jgi:hypothetical protein